MKKLANPFDSFTSEHTPIDFAVCSWLAAKWLLPYMDYNSKSHCKFVVDCVKYSDLIEKIDTPLDGCLTVQERDAIVELQASIYGEFQKIWNATVSNELARMAVKLSKAQSERASKPRKENTQNWERIAKRYLELKEQGDGYENIAALAKSYGITSQTVRNMAKRYKMNLIAK